MTSTADMVLKVLSEVQIIPDYRPYVKKHSFPEVRCSFWLLAWANGCLYNCDYCWLKAYHPWPWNEVHVADKPALTRVLEEFCAKISGSLLLNAGELCDSFIIPEYVVFMAETLRLTNDVHGRRHRLLLLTKSADPRVLVENDLQDVVVYSASINAEPEARDLEKGAPSPVERILAARRVKEAGYEVRIRVDPIIEGSDQGYLELVERVCSTVEPGLITLGSLRATPRTYRLLPDRMKAQLTERTPWGRGYPLETRLGTYSALIDVGRDHDVPMALCKESPDVWRRLKLRGPCNCMSSGGGGVR